MEGLRLQISGLRPMQGTTLKHLTKRSVVVLTTLCVFTLRVFILFLFYIIVKFLLPPFLHNTFFERNYKEIFDVL